VGIAVVAAVAMVPKLQDLVKHKKKEEKGRRTS